MRDISFLSSFPHPVTWNLWWGRLKFRVVVSVRNIISWEDELQLPRACSSHLYKPLIPIQRGCYCCILQSNTLLKKFSEKGKYKRRGAGTSLIPNSHSQELLPLCCIPQISSKLHSHITLQLFRLVC